MYQACKAQLELPKIGRDSSIYTTYAGTVGMRIYDEDMTTFTSVTESTFTYTLDEPDY